MSFGDKVRPVQDAGVAAWIEPAVSDSIGTVGGLLPAGFESYLFVQDPLDDHDGGQDPLAPHNATLARVAAGHTSTPDRAILAVWEGHGYSLNTAQRAKLRQLVLPIRTYHLVTGPVTAAAELWTGTARWPSWQQPDLWWPEDRAWIVGTDIDIWCCYVGGTAALTTAVAAAVSTPTHLVELADELECGDDDDPQADASPT